MAAARTGGLGRDHQVVPSKVDQGSYRPQRRLHGSRIRPCSGPSALQPSGRYCCSLSAVGSGRLGPVGGSDRGSIRSAWLRTQVTHSVVAVSPPSAVSTAAQYPRGRPLCQDSDDAACRRLDDRPQDGHALQDDPLPFASFGFNAAASASRSALIRCCSATRSASKIRSSISRLSAIEATSVGKTEARSESGLP
jgi:hypothetical protein